MHDTLTLQSWLDHLRTLYPVKGLVHVGAGSGHTADRYAEWDVPSAVFIEAEEMLHEKFVASINGRRGWSVHHALLSSEAGPRTFYLASNPSESGLVSPDDLTFLWRNLKTEEKRELNATTLADLLASSGAGIINWAVIDCIPALPVIQGAGQQLEAWDVIVVRAMLEKNRLRENGVSKPELDDFLAGYGYRAVAWEEELQPLLAAVLYVRDWKNCCSSIHAGLADAINQCDRQEKQLTTFQGQLDELEKARTEALKQIEEYKSRLGVAGEEKKKLEETVKKQEKLGDEQKRQIEKLTTAHSIQEKQLTTFQEQLDELEKARTEALKQIEELTKVRQEQVDLAANRQAEIVKLKAALQEAETGKKQLQSQVNELMERQQMMNEELVKAEGQIDLIKDLFLREEGL